MLRFMNGSDPSRLLHTNGNATMWEIAIEEHAEQWKEEPVLNWIFVVIMIVMSVLGTIANLLVLSSFFIIKELHQIQYMFVGNLAAADLIVTAFVIPMNVYATIVGPGIFRDISWLCEFAGTICCSVCSGSIWCIMAISVERYICICHYHLYNKIFSFNKTIVLILCIWVMAHMIHLPNFLGWGRTGYSRDLYLCTAEVELFSYSIFYGIMAVLLPICISFWAYLRVYLRVRVSKAGRKLIAAGKSAIKKTDGDAAEKGIKAKEKESSKAKKAMTEEMQLLKALFKVFIIFLISWLPLGIFFVVRAVVGFPKWYSYIGLILAHGSSATNSVIYFYMTDLVKSTVNAYKKMWRRFRGRTDVYPNSTKMNMTTVASTGTMGYQVSSTRKASMSKTGSGEENDLIKTK